MLEITIEGRASGEHVKSTLEQGPSYLVDSYANFLHMLTEYGVGFRCLDSKEIILNSFPSVEYLHDEGTFGRKPSLDWLIGDSITDAESVQYESFQNSNRSFFTLRVAALLNVFLQEF